MVVGRFLGHRWMTKTESYSVAFGFASRRGPELLCSAGVQHPQDRILLRRPYHLLLYSNPYSSNPTPALLRYFTLTLPYPR
jgi:hypothetical protein